MIATVRSDPFGWESTMKKRGFLIPLAASIAALIGAAQGQPAGRPSDEVAAIIEAARTAPPGDLFIERSTASPTDTAQHSSHYSHRSHSSHQSHSSHYSHYSGY